MWRESAQVEEILLERRLNLAPPRTTLALPKAAITENSTLSPKASRFLPQSLPLGENSHQLEGRPDLAKKQLDKYFDDLLANSPN
jgi:hypothetical protein